MSKNISIRFGGDVMLGAGVLEQIKQHSPTYPLENLIARQEKTDLFFCNLECTLTASHSPLCPKRINLHSIPAAAEGLRQSGINIVSLANNHAFDFGLEDFRQTQQILRDHNIQTVGGGGNYKEASQATTMKVNNITVAFLAYCSPDTGCRKFASETDFGVADTIEETMCQEITQAKTCSDIVIISLHWGDEFRDYPSPQNTRLARMLIDHGASIITGHHGHVLQGVERYKNGLIIYDLGSVVFGNIFNNYYKFYLKKRKHRESILVDCTFSKNGIVDYACIPIYINDSFQSIDPNPSHGKNIVQRFHRQSDQIVQKNYLQFYKRYTIKLKLRHRAAEWIHLILHPRHLFRITVKRYIKTLFLSIKNK